MLSEAVEMMETEQRTLYVVRGCGNDGNSREHCMLSEAVKVMETEQRTLYVVSGCGGDGNRTENIVCCQWLWR